MVDNITSGLKHVTLNAYAPKLPTGTAGTTTNIRTNSTELKIKPNLSIFKYDVRMFEIFPGKDGKTKEKELCKQTRDDYDEQERKQKTIHLLKHLAALKKLPRLEELVYDRAAILFSTKKFSALEIKLTPPELAQISYKHAQDLVEVRIAVKPVTEDFQLTSNDVSKGGSKEILEFMNLITSQHVFFKPGDFITYGNNTVFLYDPGCAGFQQRDLPPLSEGKYMGVGGCKTVKLLEGNGKTPTPILTVDVVKAAFHADNMPAHEKIASLLNCGVNDLARRLNDSSNKKIVTQGIKGLKFETTYLGDRNIAFSAKSLGSSAAQSKFVSDGKQVTVADYFAKKYQKVLKFPNLPVIATTKGSFFPMEVCVVAPNQRVTFNQQTPEQMKVQIRACATAPSVRLQQTDQVAKALVLAPQSTNENFKANGLTIGSTLTVQGRVLKPPVVRDKKNSPALVGNCKWSDDGFIFPATIKNWAVFGILGGGDVHNENKIENLINTLTAIGRQNGMTFEPHKYKKVDPNNLERAFEDASRNGIKFILCVQSDQLKNHDAIKALEQRYQIITQDLKFSKTFDIGKRDTMKNIIQKTNMKNGGLNHLVFDAGKHFEKLILIIGIEFTHPPPCLPGKEPSMPSVMGWSANCGTQAQAFMGDYKFIRARSSDDQSETAKCMKEVYEECINRFKKNRNAPPGLVIIYRNGASEGQYPILLNEEIPLFHRTCHEMSQGKYNPELVVIAVNKDHVHRLYKPIPGTGKPAEQNIVPGTVVDKGIVSAERNEFFLNAHSAFQGTAKTPKYTVIKNGTTKDNCLNMDVLQQITHALTFMHGIVSMTISLPAVLKVAGECAKRGSNIFKVHYGDNSSSGSGPSDLADANAKLTYSKKLLSEVRYNS